MKFFNLDSPLMRFLSRMTDILWLNILTLVMCIPAVFIAVGIIGVMNADKNYTVAGIPVLFFLIFLVASIPAGAGFTALHFVCLKLVRGEEGYITRDYFRSFKENFLQATVIWLIFEAGAYLLAWDFHLVLFSNSFTGTFHTVMIAGLTLASLMFLFTFVFTFPVLSHFKNTIRRTLKNSFLMSILVLPKTILMVLLLAIPPVAALGVPQILPLAVLFFFGAPAYFSAMLYNKTFKRFEPETEQPVGDYEWTVAPVEEGETDASSEEPAKIEEKEEKSEPDT